MNLPKSICQINAHIGSNCLLNLVLLTILVSCVSQNIMPIPDCGGMVNFEIAGNVRNETGQPISNAIVSLQNVGKGNCIGSSPIDDIAISSDQNGNFSVVLPYLSEDNILQIKVSANGYKSYVDPYILLPELKQELIIVLRQ